VYASYIAAHVPCNSLLTVEHILVNWVDFDIIQQNFYTTSKISSIIFHNFLS